jgi:hypothetical protein
MASHARVLAGELLLLVVMLLAEAVWSSSVAHPRSASRQRHTHRGCESVCGWLCPDQRSLNGAICVVQAARIR